MKKCIWFIVLISCLLCGCIRRGRTLDSQLMDSREVDFSEENENNKEDITEQWEKGYGLPVDEQEEKEAENDCRAMMECIYEIYKELEKKREFKGSSVYFITSFAVYQTAPCFYISYSRALAIIQRINRERKNGR